MANDVRQLLERADGGPVGAPDLEEIDRRARQLTLFRTGAAFAVVALVAGALVGLFGMWGQPRAPLVGEGPDRSVETLRPEQTDAPQTGAAVWSRRLDIEAFGTFGGGGQLASDGHRMYVAGGHVGDAHETAPIIALELASGELLWQTDLEGSTAFVQVAAPGLVIVNSDRGNVSALDSSTGQPVWEHTLPERYGAVASTYADDALYLVAGAGGEGNISPPRIYALALSDGQPLWSTSLSPGTHPQWSAPELTDGLLLVASTPANPQVEQGNIVHALDIRDGSETWSIDLGGGQGFTDRHTAVSDGLLHVQAAGVGVVTLEIPSGQPVHTIEDAVLFGAGPDGPLYVADTGEPTSVELVDHRSGQPHDDLSAWHLEADWFEVVVHAPDLVILPSTTRLAALDPAGTQLLWRHEQPTPAFEILVIEDMLITAGQDRHITATQIPRN